MSVPASDLFTMMVEIGNRTPAKESSLWPFTDEQRESWDRLSEQIREIYAAGHTLDIPFE